MPLTDAMAPLAWEGIHGEKEDESPETWTQCQDTHPLGIKPLGNRYLDAGVDAKTASGLFQALPDEAIMIFLEYLDIASLEALGYTCKFLFACCDYDDLWKSLALEIPSWQPDVWRGTWRASLRKPRVEGGVHIDCSRVFSDVLHRPFVCSTIALDGYAATIPTRNRIRRMADLTYEEFAASWSDTPFVLTDSCVRRWPVMQSWSLDALSKRYSETAFRAEAVDWPYALYDEYMHHMADESPLYLFDRKFAEKMGLHVGDGEPEDKKQEKETKTEAQTETDYWKPDCFGPDLFGVLGDERPAHRWLIVGPARSGSTFHKDPNGTSAWNAVVQGAKYWIMFPPSATVPGVYVSRDQSEVTSPLSIAEWLLTFHAEARQQAGCIEGVCRAGEILHVPSGWWHLVVNLEAGIALTQNFVPRAHLAKVLLFLRDRPEQVTGFASSSVADPYRLFVERLEAAHPDVLREAQTEVARRDGRRKRTWESVVGREGVGEKEGGRGNTEDDDKNSKKTCTETTGFAFGFDLDEEEEDLS